MDEPGTDALNQAVATFTDKMTEPFAKVLREAIGGAIGDRVEVWRQSKPAWKILNQRKMLLAAAQLRKESQIEDPPIDEIRPEHIAQIVEAAGENSAEEIRDLFAKLLNAAMDPARMRRYRPEFAEVVKQFQPVDALILTECVDIRFWHVEWQRKVSEKLGVGRDEAELSGKNLERLGCIAPPPTHQALTQSAVPTSLARELLKFLGG